MKWSKLFWLMGAFPVDGYKKCGKYNGRKSRIVDKDTGIRWRTLDLPNYYIENNLARLIYEEIRKIHSIGEENNEEQEPEENLEE